MLCTDTLQVGSFDLFHHFEVHKVHINTSQGHSLIPLMLKNHAVVHLYFLWVIAVPGLILITRVISLFSVVIILGNLATNFPDRLSSINYLAY
jgi:hypothetical protein